MGKKIQWHPAFYDAISLELQEYKEALIIEEEHQLTSKPLQVDVLIIKKIKAVTILKNIAKIFKGHNIVEYKSPDDYISIDDYFKVKAYAYLYKTLSSKEDEIKLEDLTISMVCSKYPKKLMNYLADKINLNITNVEEGIYYIDGGDLATQIIVISELPGLVNRYVRLLVRKLAMFQELELLYEDQEKNPTDGRYEHLIDIVEKFQIKSTFMEEIDMALVLTEKEQIALERLMDRYKWKDKWRNEGKLEGKIEGKIEGKLEGKLEGEAKSLIRILNRKFNGLPEHIKTDILRETDIAVLDNILDNIFEISSIEELGRYL